MSTSLLDRLRPSEHPDIAPLTVPGLDHLSASAIGTYLRCPRQYWWIYVRGLRIPPDGGLVSGSAMHRGAEHGMRQKMALSLDPNPSEIADVARDAAVAGLEQANAMAEETGLIEHLREEGLKPENVVDKAARTAHAWATEAAPRVEPARVEDSFSAQIGGIRVTGRLDVVETSGAVRDWKTAGKTPTVAEVISSVQTEMYATATGAPVNYTYLVDLKAGVKVVDVEVPDADLARAPRMAAETVGHVAAGVAAGSFPRNRAGWQCSRRWCGFYALCIDQSRGPATEGR